MRHYSIFDQIICTFDTALKTVAGGKTYASRPNPAEKLEEPHLAREECRQAARLMRVNHVGEVCAQALYQGQAIVAHSNFVKNKLEQAAQEENDHLIWCEQRVTELGSHTSYLNPVWYLNALMIGIIAGLAGDSISLGFLLETERQVEQHLTQHLQKLPVGDSKSRCILEQMREDEICHANLAKQTGAVELPSLVKVIMRYLSKTMTLTAYWI